MSLLAGGQVTKPAEARLKVETEPAHHQLKLVASNGTNWLKPVGEVRHCGHSPASARRAGAGAARRTRLLLATTFRWWLGE
jgi:hypothetical protein